MSALDPKMVLEKNELFTNYKGAMAEQYVPQELKAAEVGFLKSPRPDFDLAAVQSESKELHGLIRTSRQGQLKRIGPNDPTSPIRVLVELDVINAYERIRAYYLNCAETLAGGKR